MDGPVPRQLLEAAAAGAEDVRNAPSCRYAHLVKVFGDHKLTDLTSDAIEGYLRYRLRQRARWKTKSGIIEKGVLKPSTVHQELRVLRRGLNIAVRKKLLPSNPCWGVEFPVAAKGLFPPHYVSWSEQQRIEAAAPSYSRNVVPIITEPGRSEEQGRLDSRLQDGRTAWRKRR